MESVAKNLPGIRRYQMPEEVIGKVMDFFARPVVAGIDLTGTMNVGDRIHIVGHTTDLELTVDSMQINNAEVKEAKAGDAVGIKVTDRVRKGDTVYKVIE
jgi:translation elongation factor EF-Tu-like GTPase